MRLNFVPDFRPTRGVDPDTAIFYLELCGGSIFYKFWHSGRARFPFFAVTAGDQLRETLGDERGCVGLTIALHRRAQQLGYAAQNVYRPIFSVAAQTNHCGD